MQIKRNNQNREYSKELAFDVETFIQANEWNFQKDFESSIEWTGTHADDVDAFHEYIYWEESREYAIDVIGELHVLYLGRSIPTDEELEQDDKENLAKDARGW